MCIMEIQALCDKRFSELLADEVESAELAVEDVMSHVLLDLFGEGMVEEVNICFPANHRRGLQDCAIQIRAQSPCHCFTPFPRAEDCIEFAIEKSVGALLRELFVSVNIASVTLSHTPSWLL